MDGTQNPKALPPASKPRHDAQTRSKANSRKLAIGLMVSTAALAFSLVFSQTDEIKVGILHSLTGTMAISEITVFNASELAIREINTAGGVLGKRLVAVKEDGASNWPTFAQLAEKLITQDQVKVVFGGWTSASRKELLPVFQKHNHLLFYPVQFEGNECSPNIIYTGAQPNQQALPALDWVFAKNYKRVFLLGSDYVYPRTANLILRKHITERKGVVAGEEYVKLGGTDFSFAVAKIRTSKPQVIISTINGDSNTAFFKQYQAAGFKAATLPVMSFSIAEQEAQAIGPKLLAGQFGAWNYFQSLNNRSNLRFVAAYKRQYGADAVITDPMAHAYINVYLWKAAVEKANSIEPEAVRKAIVGIKLENTPLGSISIEQNGSLTQRVLIGQSGNNGQFKIISQSSGLVKPQPYDQLTFPGKTCP